MISQKCRNYIHDSAAAFRLEIIGRLSGEAAAEIEQIWRTASPTLAGRAFVIDINGVTDVDSAGRIMLRRWHELGAQVVATGAEPTKIVASVTGQDPEIISERAPSAKYRPFLQRINGALVLVLFLTLVTVLGVELKKETVQSWDKYIAAARAREDRHLHPGKPFLWSDEVPEQAARLRGGEIVVAPVGPRVPLKVPSGLIHDWIGAAFIPNAKMSDVLPVVRDYARYKDYYQPNVVDSKPLASKDGLDRFSVVVRNKSVVSKIAVDADYQSEFKQLDDHRWYAISEATRIQELTAYGTESQRQLPADTGTGLIWRVNSFNRWEERDGGVYLEVEAILLSRDIPFALHWLVDPIVRRESKASLDTSLRQTREAVLTKMDRSRLSARPAGSG